MNILLIKTPSYKRIFPFVLCLHALLILWTYYSSEWKPFETASKKQLHVSTIALHPRIKPPFEKPARQIVLPGTAVQLPEKNGENAFSASPKNVVEPRPKPIAKKPLLKSTPKKTETLVRKPAKKQVTGKKAVEKAVVTKPKTQTSKQAIGSSLVKNDAAKQKQQALLAKAKASMQKMAKKQAAEENPMVAVATPEKINSLQSTELMIETQAKLNPQEISYRDELALRLKNLMQLPEYGETSLKLTLDRFGKVLLVKIIASENSSNQKHIEETLPKLKLPPFGKNFADLAEYTFTITINNS